MSHTILYLLQSEPLDEPYFRSVEDVDEFLFDPTLGDHHLMSSLLAIQIQTTT